VPGTGKSKGLYIRGNLPANLPKVVSKSITQAEGGWSFNWQAAGQFTVIRARLLFHGLWLRDPGSTSIQ